MAGHKAARGKKFLVCQVLNKDKKKDNLLEFHEIHFS
jgi:hypothetical protein